MSLREKGETVPKLFAADLLGSAFYSVGLYTFASGGEFAPGGVSGIALILSEIFSLPVGLLVMGLNLPLLYISRKFLGKKFLRRTLFTGIVTTVFLDIILPRFPIYAENRIISALGAGIFIGLGLGIYYSAGTSSGGIDLVTLSIRARKPHLRLGFLMLLLDLPIIGAGYFLYGDAASVLLGFLATSVEAGTVELIMKLVNKKRPD